MFLPRALSIFESNSNSSGEYCEVYVCREVNGVWRAVTLAQGRGDDISVAALHSSLFAPPPR